MQSFQKMSRDHATFKSRNLASDVLLHWLKPYLKIDGLCRIRNGDEGFSGYHKIN